MSQDKHVDIKKKENLFQIFKVYKTNVKREINLIPDDDTNVKDILKSINFQKIK